MTSMLSCKAFARPTQMSVYQSFPLLDRCRTSTTSFDSIYEPEGFRCNTLTGQLKTILENIEMRNEYRLNADLEKASDPLQLRFRYLHMDADCISYNPVLYEPFTAGVNPVHRRLIELFGNDRIYIQNPECSAKLVQFQEKWMEQQDEHRRRKLVNNGLLLERKIRLERLKRGERKTTGRRRTKPVKLVDNKHAKKPKETRIQEVDKRALSDIGHLTSSGGAAKWMHPTHKSLTVSELYKTADILLNPDTLMPTTTKTILSVKAWKKKDAEEKKKKKKKRKVTIDTAKVEPLRTDTTDTADTTSLSEASISEFSDDLEGNDPKKKKKKKGFLKRMLERIRTTVLTSKFSDDRSEMKDDLFS